MNNKLLITIISGLALIFFLLIWVYSSKPEIPISNTLELALKEKGMYYDYKSDLNKAINGDTVAFKRFLAINYIYDAAGYDHGWVLVELMKKVGDKKFSKLLKASEVSTVSDYFEVGIDGLASDDSIYIKYPDSFRVLGLR